MSIWKTQERALILAIQSWELFSTVEIWSLANQFEGGSLVVYPGIDTFEVVSRIENTTTSTTWIISSMQLAYFLKRLVLWLQEILHARAHGEVVHQRMPSFSSKHFEFRGVRHDSMTYQYMMFLSRLVKDLDHIV